MKPRHRRLLIVLGVCLLLLLLLWFLWLAVERHRFTLALDDLRARSEPLSLAALELPPIPDSLNAAPLYLRALVPLETLSQPDFKELHELAVPGLLPADRLPAARLFLDRSSEPLDLLLRAASFSRCRYPVDRALAPYMRRRLYLGAFPTAAELLVLSSKLHLAANAPDLALRDCLAGVRLADSLRDEPALVPLFQRERVYRVVLRQAALVLDSSDPSPDALRDFLSVLGDTSDRSQFVRALQGERCVGVALVADILGSKLSDSDLRDMGIGAHPFLSRCAAFALRPVILADAAEYIRILNAAEACAASPSCVSSAPWRAIAVPWLAGTIRHPWTRPLLAVILPAIPRAAASVDVNLASRSLAAQGVALRLYRLAHGRYPDSLSALVPDFLPALPPDPFSGNPFLYKPLGPGFLLYSLGPNLSDDSGAPTSPDSDAGDISWRSSR